MIIIDNRYKLKYIYHMEKEFYEILGIPRSSSEKEIKQAYRRLARQYHPDVNKNDKSAEEKFKQINEAYEVLSDQNKRKLYDSYGHNWKQAEGMNGDGFNPFAHNNMGFNFGGFQNINLGNMFDGFFGNRSQNYQSSYNQTKPKPSEVSVDVSLLEAFTGCQRIVKTPSNTKSVEVKIPPGVDNGSKIHINLSGTDIYLNIKVTPHHQYLRKGNNIYIDLAVPYYDAIIGTEKEVTTLSKKVMLKIPPESQNDQIFKLQGLGMPILGEQEKNGDFFVQLKSILPTGLSDKEKEIFTSLKSLREKPGVTNE